VIAGVNICYVPCMKEIETVLFAVTSLAEGVAVDENVHMPAIFALLAQIPSSSDYTLVNQALYFVGQFLMLFLLCSIKLGYVDR